MRLTVLAALTSLLIGFGAGVAFGTRTIVIHDRELAAAPLAPEMSLDRFFTVAKRVATKRGD